MPPPVPLRAQIAEIKRELTMRARVYPRMIETGKLAAPDAERRIAALEAALATLEHIAEERFKAERVKAQIKDAMQLQVDVSRHLLARASRR